MAKDEKLNKWIEAMTPRRAIDIFFENATPVDSPDPEEVYESAVNVAPSELIEFTPLARSSQSSQRSGLKRKGGYEEQFQGNASKRINSAEIDISQGGSNSETLEFPSNLESPDMIIPQRPTFKKKRKMSVTAFAKAIHSQETQKSNNTVDEPSIASTLGSPDEALSQRPVRLRKKPTSVSDFAETLGKRIGEKTIQDQPAFTLDSSNMESASILSHLDSPENVSYQKRETVARKKRTSSTGFKTILNKRSFEKSELLEDAPVEHSTLSPATITEQIVHSKSPRMSPAFESSPSIFLDVRSQIDKTPDDVRSNISDSESSEDSNMPELESPDELPPPVLSMHRKSSIRPDLAKDSEMSVVRPNETMPSVPFVSQDENLTSVSSGNSTSDVPSALDSPQEYKKYTRPGLAPVKRRVSATGFLAALSQKTVDMPPLDPLPRSSTPEASTSLISASPSKLRTSISINKTSSILLKEVEQKSHSPSQVSNESLVSMTPHSKTIRQPSLGDSVPEETDDLLLRNARSSALELTGRITRTSNQVFDKTMASPKSGARKTPPPESKGNDSDASDHSLVNKSTSALINKTGEISRSSSRISKKSWKADSRRIEQTESGKSDSDKVVGLLLNETPTKGDREMRTNSRSSSRIANKSSLASKSSPSKIPHPELDDRATRDSEGDVPMQVEKSISLIEITSPILAPIEARASSVLLTPERRIRKSLQFDSSIIKDSSPVTPLAKNDLPPVVEAQEIEEIPPTDLESTEEGTASEDDHSIDEMEKEDKIEDGLSTPKTITRSPRESGHITRKSDSTQMSLSNRYPALKNSTVVAGGSEFAGAQLSMSPIAPVKQGPSLQVPPSPRSVTPESPKTTAPSKTNVKSTPPKKLHKTPSHPSTPAPFARKRTSSLTQSPMFMNVMKSSVQKAISKTVRDQQPLIPTMSAVSAIEKSTTPMPIASAKGLSISNPQKGKSPSVSKFDEIAESSDTEWEDVEDDQNTKPSCIKIAFEQIPDRTKNFVPLEKRLMADPIFQAKVKIQRAKVAAQKAAEEAATKKAKPQKKQRVVIKKKEEDNITNVSTNKANLRFYARTKVTKEAMETVHGLVGQWFEFTLRQIEKYCIDEGKSTLDTWQDCYKVIKRQGLVDSHADYSGLCHELLMNDECSQLLPSQFPPEFAEWKRQAPK